MEKKLLLLLLLNSEKSVVEKIFKIDPSIFSREGRFLFNLCKKSFLDNGIIDINEKILQLKENKKAESYLQDILEQEADEELLDIYLEKFKLEIIYKKIENLNNCATKTEILKGFEDIRNLINDDSSKAKEHTLEDLCKDFFLNLDAKKNSEEVVKTKNWSKFNNFVNLEKQDLAIIAGRPGSGKTAFALSYMLELQNNGHRGIFFSLEMSEQQLMKRIIAQLSRVNLRSFSDYTTYSYLKEYDLQKIVVAQQKIFECADSIKIISGNFTTQDIRDRCILAKESGLDYIIVDYLQIIKNDSKGSRYEKITDISIELKRIAKELGISVIALAQLSREVEKRSGDEKKPLMSDLKESGQIEQDASIIFGLYRPAYYDDEKDYNLLEVEILKNRSGECVDLNFYCDMSCQFIKENYDVKGEVITCY